jgi:hypothetical protein
MVSLCVHHVLRQPSSFYRLRWGSVIDSFSRKELLCRGKTGCSNSIKSCVSTCTPIVWTYLVMLFKTCCVGSEQLRCYHYRLCATPTPSHHSLGLGVARRVVGPVDGQVHSVLGLIGHEWVAGLEADRSWVEGHTPHCGSTLDTVIVADHLWQISPGSGVEFTGMAFSRFSWPPFGFASTDLELGASGLSGDRSFRDVHFPRLPADSWALGARDLPPPPPKFMIYIF